jgi:peptidylprolyl isomerase
VSAPPGDATVTESGLAYKVLAKGSGPSPQPDSVVRVHYTGWTTDGKTFDSSVAREEPIEFPLTAVIPGWVEGLQLMNEGAQHRLWIPEDLAYKGKPGKPAGTLVFDVQLLAVLPAED